MAGKIPTWAQKLVTEQDFLAIEQAVQKAELETSGEIIPMVVRRSVNIGHMPLTISLILFSITLFLQYEFQNYLWGHEYFIYIQPVLLLIFYFLAIPLSGCSLLQRFLTTKNDQIHDVYTRAEVEFYRGKYHQTKEKTAILLFVSVLERRAVVLADENISSKVNSSKWSETVHLLTSHIAEGKMAEGFEKAIQKSSAILAEHFPLQGNDKNEISNQFIMKD